MKKFITICLILFQFNIVLADNLTSTNNFPFLLEENDIPDNGGGGTDNNNNKDDNGLDGKAVSAITLGSIGVVGLGAIGYFLFYKFKKEGLILNKITGCDNPILSICLDKCSSIKFIKKYPNYPLLKKAIEEQEEIKTCPNSRYILIPDTELPNKHYDIYIFEIPKGLNNIKITQAIQNENEKLKFDLYEDKTQETEIKLNTIKNHKDILIKFGINSNSKYGVLTVIHNNLINQKTELQKYAIVIEISK